MDKKTSEIKAIKSLMLKLGKKTYFFDVKVSTNNRKYLKITESVFEGEGKARKYNSLLLFPEQVQEFAQRLNESMGYLA